MRTAHSVETVRAAERELMARLPEGALMQRAAAGLAAACAGLLGRTYGTRVALLVGSGDNGGDALYAGARLARRGAGVSAVLLTPERAHPGGLAALRAAGGRAIDADPAAGAARSALARADLVIDGIVGIGGKGGLREPAAELVRVAEDAGAVIVAVDLPSGIDADSGEVRGAAVRADATVTFGTYKPGLLIDPAREHTGVLRLVDIGLGPLLPAVPEVAALQHAEVAAALPRPSAESDKYRRGVVGVAAGSERYPGAGVLAVGGALRGGAGTVRYAGSAADAVIARYPETLVSGGLPSAAGRVQCWVVGPGLGDGPRAREVLDDVLAAEVPVVVDADGLRLLDRERCLARTAPTLLTPHAGEAARLLGAAGADVRRSDVEGARLSAVREIAAGYGATTLLKGSTTLIAEPGGGTVLANPTGTPWLATAGSGDVLAGLLGSLLAAGLTTGKGAAVGAYLHGLAGRFATLPAAADDVAAALPAAWQAMLGKDRGRDQGRVRPEPMAR